MRYSIKLLLISVLLGSPLLAQDSESKDKDKDNSIVNFKVEIPKLEKLVEITEKSLTESNEALREMKSSLKKTVDVINERLNDDELNDETIVALESLLKESQSGSGRISRIE